MINSSAIVSPIKANISNIMSNRPIFLYFDLLRTTHHSHIFRSNCMWVTYLLYRVKWVIASNDLCEVILTLTLVFPLRYFPQYLYLSEPLMLLKLVKRSIPAWREILLLAQFHLSSNKHVKKHETWPPHNATCSHSPRSQRKVLKIRWFPDYDFIFCYIWWIFFLVRLVAWWTGVSSVKKALCCYFYPVSVVL